VGTTHLVKTKKATFEELGQFIYQDLKEIESQKESASLNR